ncbi:TonB-dependent receptor [Sphingosinicella rhizophila]|uniref:TonB-dependent receptor n=1 Tax=Sphingosinicella rhizophila TaxID=3050082 RepID=A0ABU3QAF8_9SPHN|nr:TonB-dependent receptor [Sphingosinicella sp. GR2756]MDT9600312.1 TonB-dependent receptor [Sphingosinicella sp. GR2756]
MKDARAIRLHQRTALLGGIAIAVLWANPAAAAERQRYNLSSGNAAQRVQALAVQSGVQVMAPQEDLSGITTRPVTGEYTPVEAFRQMLGGTGLEVVANGEDTVIIRRASLAAQNPQYNDSADPMAMPGTEQAEEAEQDIVVTGSRIRRPGYDTLESTFVTDSELIEQRGYTNVVQALDETPGFVASGVNPTGASQGTFNAGQSFVDFLGLGSQRTLALINGRRAVTSNSISGSGNAAAPGQQVDLNVIPVGLIERVESIAIGGAPIYGSDAIAGTVNIILKDDYEGVSVTGQYGISERGDAEGWSIRGLAGANFADGRGNIAISAEHHDQKGVVLGERSGLFYAIPNSGPGPSNVVIEDLVYGYISEGGLPFNPNTFDFIRNGSGQRVQFANGDLIPFVPGPVVSDPFYNGGDGMRMADHYSLLSPTQRTIVSGIGHFDITPSIRWFGEASYARSEGKELSEVAAFTSPYISGTILPVSIDNAFLSADARNILAANGVTGDFILARNFSDLLDRGGLTVNTVNFFRAVTGLEGKFSLFGQPAGWDVSVNYGRSKATTELSYINESKLLAAIDAVSVGGNVVCASGGDCVPFNIFGENAFSDEAADYVLDDGRAVSLNTQFIVNANLNGALPFRIAAEPIEFNIGLEHRREKGSFTTDALLAGGTSLLGLNLASPYLPGKGKFNTKEAYGELSIPIVSASQDMAVIKSLSIDAAARYVDNSITGSDLTWTAGGRFAPRLPGILDGLLFRGTYTRAIRAPAVTELFSGASPTRGRLNDPCGANLFQEGDNPAVREANCRAELQAFGLTPETFNPTTFGVSPIGTISGNENLQNEKSRAWSAGVVFQPTRLPGFRFAADWTQIKLKGGIESLSINQVMAACYDSSDFPNNPACDQFRRLQSGEAGPGTENPIRIVGDVANGYSSGYINTASLKYSGLIMAGEYVFGVPSIESEGTIRLGAKAIYNDTYEFQTTASAPVSNSVGGVGLPKWSGQFNVGYRGSHLDLLLQALYTGPVKNDILATSDDIADEYNLISSYWRFNSTIGFRINDRFSAQLVINNLFDRKPSKSAIFSRSFGTYDLIGRRFLFSVTAGF